MITGILLVIFAICIASFLIGLLVPALFVFCIKLFLVLCVIGFVSFLVALLMLII